MAVRVYDNIKDTCYKVRAQSISVEFYPRNKYYGTIYDDCMCIFEGQKCLVEINGTTVTDIIKEFIQSITKENRKELMEYIKYVTELEEEEVR